MKGWTQWFEYAPTIVMIGMMVLGYLVAGIFSNEYAWKADSVFFSSEYGRNKAIRAKVWAGFLIATGVYWVMILVYSAFTFAFWGGRRMELSGSGGLFQLEMLLQCDQSAGISDGGHRRICGMPFLFPSCVC